MIQDLRLHKPTTLQIISSSIDFFRSFFGWWYGDIPLALFALLRRVFQVFNDTTSFGVILRGYFRPWKNDYNIAGWLVGMVIKTIYLPLSGSLFILILGLFFALLLLQLAVLPVVIGLIIINPFLAA